MDLDFRTIDDTTLNSIVTDDMTILSALAAENKKYIDLQGKTRWFGLYTLQHRGNYVERSSGSDPRNESYAVIKNDAFYNKINGPQGISLHSVLSTDIKTKQDHPKWLYDINTNTLIVAHNNSVEYDLTNGVTLINEIDGLGQYQHATNMRSGAVINASFISNPIAYEGYISVWNGGGRRISSGTCPFIGGSDGIYYEIGSPANSDEEYTIFTLGGAPLAEDNWIIAYVERGISSGITNYAENAAAINKYIKKYACSVVEDTEYKYKFNMQIYINLFMPGGKLVRTKLDRTNLYFNATTQNGASGPGHIYAYNNWVYRDYANTAAQNAGMTFSSVWNSIINKTYIQFGPVRGSDFRRKTNDTHWLFHWDTGTSIDVENNFNGTDYEHIKNDEANNYTTWQADAPGWNGEGR